MAASIRNVKWIAVIILSVLVLLTGCGGGTGGNQTSDEQPSGDSATLSLELEFPSTQDDKSSSGHFEPDVCDDYLIDTVEFQIYEGADLNPVITGSFSCREHIGTISSLPTDTELRVSVTGHVGDQPDWFSQINQIVLTAGGIHVQQCGRQQHYPVKIPADTVILVYGFGRQNRQRQRYGNQRSGGYRLRWPVHGPVHGRRHRHINGLGGCQFGIYRMGWRRLQRYRSMPIGRGCTGGCDSRF